MNNINTNPQENPITEFYEAVLDRPEPVSAGIRFLNYLIDLAVLVVIIIAVLLATDTVGEDGSSARSQFAPNIIFYFISLAYYFVCEVTMGRTIGKLLTGTKVVSETGGKPSVTNILGRTLSRIVPFEAFSFLGNPVGWHDRWSHTMVVKVNKDKN